MNPKPKTVKDQREERLSPDGKWRSFPKVPNLLQYVSTGGYYARVRTNGKLIRRSLETATFSVAKLKLHDFISGESDRRVPSYSARTFDDARKLYAADLEIDAGLSATTKRYRNFCLKLIGRTWPDLGPTDLHRITDADCKAWAQRLARSGKDGGQIDAQYFNNTLGTFRAILKRVGIEGKRDPSREISRMGVKPNKLHLPTREQFNAILRHMETSGAGQAQDCADFARFLAFSGCRLSEARRVTWADVDLSKGVLTVHSAKVKAVSDRSERRNVPVNPSLRELLERLALKRSGPSERVCGVGECEKSLTRACKLEGVPNLTHHDLRHLFATRCIEAGVDVPTVSRWLGHADGGALAMRIYGHLRDDHSAAMAAKVSF